MDKAKSYNFYIPVQRDDEQCECELLERINELEVENALLFNYLLALSEKHIATKEMLNEIGEGVKPDDIRKVIYSDRHTIIIWADGSKTVVKCRKEDKYDARLGFALALLKSLTTPKNYRAIMKKFVYENPDYIALTKGSDKAKGRKAKKEKETDIKIPF